MQKALGLCTNLNGYIFLSFGLFEGTKTSMVMKWAEHLSIKTKMAEEETEKVGCEHYQRKCAFIVSTRHYLSVA